MSTISSLSAQAPVIAAALKAKLVDSLIKAMRNADASVAGLKNERFIGPPQPFPTQTHHVGEHQFEHRHIIHRRPIVEGPSVIHTHPRIEQQQLAAPCPAFCCPEEKMATCGTMLQPPWKVLPWPQHPVVRPHFKPPPSQPDMLVKGLLIDIFI